MSTLTELYIFEVVSREHDTRSHEVIGSNVLEGKLLPYEFARGFLLTNDLLMLGLALYIAITTQAPVVIRAGLELLFIGAYVLLLFARSTKQFRRAIGTYLAAIGLTVIINLVFPGAWGLVILYILFVTVSYRFPPRWALPLAALGFFALIVTAGVFRHLPNQLGMLGFNLALMIGLCWFGWTRRTQYLLVVRLRETQEQLRKQIARSEELAAERERTRIARDIHDVLSHSLAVLSIQVQAARHLRTRDTERLAAKLDEMAVLIRESIAESRRVVGLLREKPATDATQDALSTSLQSLVLTFNERTGISCHFEERGIPHEVSTQHREILHQALREMLTNAHRHGAAQTTWVTLQWREIDVLLEVRDDGVAANGTLVDTPVQESDGHHGLQGMRERATTLGGQVNADPQETGGFLVSVSLPYEQSNERTANLHPLKGKR